MLPNYLLMKEMEGKYDDHIFITTAKMKGLGRGRRLEQALGLPEKYIYELAAISKDFGLIVNPYLFTLHRFNRISPLAMQAIEKRMKILGIKGILENEAFKQQKLDI